MERADPHLVAERGLEKHAPCSLLEGVVEALDHTILPWRVRAGEVLRDEIVVAELGELPQELTAGVAVDALDLASGAVQLVEFCEGGACVTLALQALDPAITRAAVDDDDGPSAATDGCDILRGADEIHTDRVHRWQV